MMLAGTVLVWTPALLFALGFALAHLTGCRVDEGSAHPCLVAGIDIGRLLYTLMMMGWFVILMLPFMLLTLVIWLGIGLRALVGAWFP
ncbi:MAG TPA: hypothetical protein VGU70_13805 [Methylobacterium sp.]|jgi:hypothetical protein|uniref:hypothetical protein n=1 Tax=Methylorubrum sp. B1-46 TaxID=2897334 RepID=UPI001E520429|nr:hypothetical protein [Methylorubrum sp. B1-46]UGB26766.1 hypothetical protein LPC10_03935 [Methylorubrum sp. B1-46]HEV2543827.1 hypothetical protein [Methylobacterium sp.]